MRELDAAPGERPVGQTHGTLHLVRHAHAGSRAAWSGDDRERPLSAKGREQAEAISGSLLGAGVAQVRTSPFVRCRQTVEPLAGRLGLALVDDHLLAEGADPVAALESLMAAVAAGGVVVACSHGDLIPELVAEASRNGAAVDGPAELRKGARYVVSVEGGRPVHLDHVPRPEV